MQVQVQDDSNGSLMALMVQVRMSEDDVMFLKKTMEFHIVKHKFLINYNIPKVG